MILVNFKTYPAGTGEEAVEMARVIERVSQETGVRMRSVVQGVDVFRVSQQVLSELWCQHADGIGYGSHSGWLLPEGIKSAGAAGVMLNHSERKISQKSEFSLEKAVERCREVGLKVGICADGLKEVEAVLAFNPDWIAYEPPELIGSSEISVAAAKPEIVKRAAELVADKTDLYIGAGVHEAHDVRVGLELGAKGFLLASAVMKAEDPAGKLRELAGGYGQ